MNNNKARRSCPICSEKQTSILHTQKFILPDGHPLTNGYDVVSCRTCGFIFADVQVAQEVYDFYYAQFSKYGDTKNSTGGGQNPVDAARLKETARIISTELPDKHSKILEIGCANGGLLKELKALGYRNLLGIDPAYICVENTNRQAGVTAMMGSLFKIPRRIGKFNLIILSHVLEHVQDLQRAIREISQLVAENGNVFIEVPDATRYADHVIAPFQDFNTEHINHFSSRAIRNLFAKINFVPLKELKRTILINKDNEYPVISSLLMKGKPDRTIHFDKILNSSIIDYISISKEILNKLDLHLQKILADHPKIIVWGTGQLAMKLLADTCLGMANIVNFVDGNPINQGKSIIGVQVISPQGVKSIDPYPIIITTLLHQQSILEDIQQAGLTNQVYTLE